MNPRLLAHRNPSDVAAPLRHGDHLICAALDEVRFVQCCCCWCCSFGYRKSALNKMYLKKKRIHCSWIYAQRLTDLFEVELTLIRRFVCRLPRFRAPSFQITSNAAIGILCVSSTFKSANECIECSSRFVINQFTKVALQRIKAYHCLVVSCNRIHRWLSCKRRRIFKRHYGMIWSWSKFVRPSMW